MPEPPKPFRKTPTSEHEADGFYASALQFFYAGQPPLVEYIELSRSPEFRAMFFGVSVFDTPATDLLSAIGAFHDYDSDGSSDPCDVVFPDLQVSLWRPYTGPDDERSRYFSTIGVARHGYYT
jgi:hypothetical protein